MSPERILPLVGSIIRSHAKRYQASHFQTPRIVEGWHFPMHPLIVIVNAFKTCDLPAETLCGDKTVHSYGGFQIAPAKNELIRMSVYASAVQ